MAWRLWLKGLIAAIVGGTATTVTVVIVDPSTFNLQAGWKNLVTVMAVSGILNMAMYLKEHPVPEPSPETPRV